ncbi:hypothetical protein BU25DRAFT_21991 [Macroventuria anomochaeta]|uniref:Uncharacterized protein n=1 Tax=Macroventuria anomochaeta TaxID=301207 RepID=A0ACB6S5B0_9PLEO|nr:uncharacterized protein BU25DRAFT_21991 [Macroventuria anomochaeta]KAF2629450.1 hypothetical protein BU25DRAFT_21991 [Macroventuria anomochaeta]
MEFSSVVSNGWERKSLACIAFCSDSLILTDLRVFVHRRQEQVWQRIPSCFRCQWLQIVVGMVVLCRYLIRSLWYICTDCWSSCDSLASRHQQLIYQSKYKNMA